MQCNKCKFWTKETDSDYPKHFELGKCTRVKLFWECTEWGDLPNDDYGRVLTDEAKDNKAFVQDGSDYAAELLTLSDFGCVQFEEI